jgi:hypothetical protein
MQWQGVSIFDTWTKQLEMRVTMLLKVKKQQLLFVTWTSNRARDAMIEESF